MKKRFVLAFAIPFALTGCVNPSMSTFKGSKTFPAYTPPLQPPQAVAAAKDPDAYRTSDPGRSYSLTLKNADLHDVLMLLSKESGTSIVAERGLKGIVQVEAKNKKLGELLYTILKPLGYTASVENGVILVGRPKLTTRTFRINYLKDTRNSSSNMSVSGFNAGGSGSVSVSTTGKSDFWGAVETSLEMLVFGTTGKGKRDGGGYLVGEAEKKFVPTSTSAATEKKGALQEIDDPMLSSAQLNDNQLKQLVVNEIAGIIQITDFPENLDKIAAFLSDIEEGSKRQVLIQAHIMEVSLKDSFSMGIDWKTIIDKSSNFSLKQTLIPSSTNTATASSSVFKVSAVGDSFGVMLDAMKEQGNVNMLSSPKITALNNQKAVIKLTTKEVSWVSTKTTSNTANSTDTFTTTPQIDEVGIFLDVTPQIGPDGSIIMQIHPSVSEIREVSTSPDKTSTKPVIDVREIDTMVDAKAGETVVIAGLISDKLLESKRSVPLLGDIPYLGALFSYSNQTRAKTELVIMMTPYFLNARSFEELRKEHEARMQNIGGDFHLINNIGSLVTEKSSRDWLMKSEQSQPQPTAPEAAKPVEKRDPVPPVKPAEPLAVPIAPAPQSLAPATSTPTPVEPKIVVVTPTETLQKLEQQQATIQKLENEMAAAQERLKQERQANETRLAEERRAAEIARQIQLQKIETLQNSAAQLTAAPSPPQQPQQAAAIPSPESTPAAGSVQTVSVTSDREQTLYRSAVTAYKIGNCSEAIKAFDGFSKLYPNSPFAGDVSYYRKDCSDRLASASK
jgi:MSHA type pilus biogenesis protein MshL